MKSSQLCNVLHPNGVQNMRVFDFMAKDNLDQYKDQITNLWWYIYITVPLSCTMDECHMFGITVLKYVCTTFL